MKKIYIVMIFMALFLSACTGTSQQTPIPTVSLDNNNSSSSGTQPSDANSVSASATIVPLKKADLSFANVGRVKAVNVKVGDQVTAGKVLIELDTTLWAAKV